MKALFPHLGIIAWKPVNGAELHTVHSAAGQASWTSQAAVTSGLD